MFLADSVCIYLITYFDYAVQQTKARLSMFLYTIVDKRWVGSSIANCIVKTIISILNVKFSQITATHDPLALTLLTNYVVL